MGEELKYNVTKAHRIANVTAWKAQVKVFEAAEKAWRKAYGEYHGAEMALSQETAIAEQERATINSVREMLKKLESAEADVLGSCPLDKIGAVCSGQGDCKTNTTDPHRTKYCACKAGSGRTGRDCSMCKFGWKMATGDLKGFCKQVYVPTVTFLQTSSSQQYSVEDLNQAVATLMQTGRHAVLLCHRGPPHRPREDTRRQGAHGGLGEEEGQGHPRGGGAEGDLQGYLRHVLVRAPHAPQGDRAP